LLDLHSNREEIASRALNMVKFDVVRLTFGEILPGRALCCPMEVVSEVAVTIYIDQFLWRFIIVCSLAQVEVALIITSHEELVGGSFRRNKPALEYLSVVRTDVLWTLKMKLKAVLSGPSFHIIIDGANANPCRCLGTVD